MVVVKKLVLKVQILKCDQKHGLSYNQIMNKATGQLLIFQYQAISAHLNV